uniref:Apovitellenin-1 n=1 Tax=Xenopus tropicalis TaxID=8364 RepID=A0A6I8RBK1_XENTR
MATVTLPVIPTIPRRHQYHLFWKPLLETGAKSISKRHVRRDWLIIPDTFAFTIYESVNNLYPPAGKVLMDIFETPAVQNTRYKGFIIDITSQLTLKGEELQSKITDFWNKISAKVKTDTN